MGRKRYDRDHAAERKNQLGRNFPTVTQFLFLIFGKLWPIDLEVVGLDLKKK